ncbi:hypothetical protein [Patiriisocius marinus]|uniref:Uncharacterized protein n=1 Tax=Patiriisocius marinus TaxID=1397112 RepID=A0A5J4IN11_9FLAO|nr:hypothetical protein [Patiriisocius marinus]GER58739.1 hypothetical protein ULMA_08470 [Patiriisocius marinus]
MKNYDPKMLEIQLKKRLPYRYQWGRKQSDKWDAFTSFIYDTPQWDDFISKLKLSVETLNADKSSLFDYAANRWYNFWSAMAVETIFNSHPSVTHVTNYRDSEKDFYINDMPFDHKTSVFPKHLKNMNPSDKLKVELIEWFYENQSGEKRYHLKNRLFVVVHNTNGEHWKLKADISLLKNAIENYLENYSLEQMHCFTFADTPVYSDIIWVSK